MPEEDHATVAIESFVALAEVDPIYYDRAYYMSPDGSPKAYALLHEVAGEHRASVAVARVLLRTRSHLALVRVLDDHLVLETMYFDAEIVDASRDPTGKGKPHVDKKQLDVAEQLVESMTIEWDPARYKDEYTAKVKQVIEKKIEGGEVVESPMAPAGEGGARWSTCSTRYAPASTRPRRAARSTPRRSPTSPTCIRSRAVGSARDQAR